MWLASCQLWLKHRSREILGTFFRPQHLSSPRRSHESESLHIAVPTLNRPPLAPAICCGVRVELETVTVFPHVPASRLTLIRPLGAHLELPELFFDTMLQPRLRPLVQSSSAICRTQIRPAIFRTYATPSVQPPSQPNAPPAAISPFASAFAAPTQAKASSETVLMRTYKPRTPGVRHLKRPINDHLWKGRPFLPLTIPHKGMAKSGRNNTGHITVRHRGGGAKRRIRTVDFHRWAPGPHLVERIEHDPGRSAHIALITNQETGRKSYIVAADGMRAGDIVQSYRSGIPQDLLDSMGGIVDPGILAAKTAWRGNCLPMHMIPVGTTVYNVGSKATGPAVFCRSAGTYAFVIAKEEETRDDGNKVMVGKYVNVRLQSGEIRKVSKDACATIGVASNKHHQHRQLGKAGRSRWLGIRPTVRGLAMNACKSSYDPRGIRQALTGGNSRASSRWWSWKV